MSLVDSDTPEKVRHPLEWPEPLGFLFKMHRYKVAYGGRGASKTFNFAQALLLLGGNQKLRILCAREIMNSIRDSVHKTLSDAIERLGMSSHYTVLDTEIRGANGTEFIFAGLHGKSVHSLKSYEGVDICWVEEAQSVTAESWKILVPTIRAPNSEIWVSFNPDMDDDETYKRFVVNKASVDGVVVKVNYRDNPWFPIELQKERLRDKALLPPEEYENIWEGMPKTVVTGAIYTREVAAMVTDARFRPMPYDPRLPVHTVWDLGWADSMSIIMVQKPTPSSLVVINYLEDSQMTYAEYVRDLNALPYMWGTDWLPHDADHRDPKTGKTAVQILQGLGRKKVMTIGRDDVEDGIKLARLMFPRVYLDNTLRTRHTGHLGGSRLFDCLKRYKRHTPKSTGEPAGPVHDQYSHGADCWRYLATIADQIRNDGDRPPRERMSPYRNTDPGMGMLG